MNVSKAKLYAGLYRSVITKRPEMEFKLIGVSLFLFLKGDDGYLYDHEENVDETGGEPRWFLSNDGFEAILCEQNIAIYLIEAFWIRKLPSGFFLLGDRDYFTVSQDVTHAAEWHETPFEALSKYYLRK